MRLSESSNQSKDSSAEVAVVDGLIKLLVPDLSLLEDPQDDLVTVAKVDEGMHRQSEGS